MTAMPPEPGFSAGAGPGLPPQPPAYPPPAYPPPAYPPPPEPSPQDLLGPPRPSKMSGLRIVVGILWGIITVILAAGAVAEWVTGIHGGAILCFVLAVGTGWYDYRVWTLRARRLLLII